METTGENRRIFTALCYFTKGTVENQIFKYLVTIPIIGVERQFKQ